MESNNDWQKRQNAVSQNLFSKTAINSFPEFRVTKWTPTVKCGFRNSAFISILENFRQI